MSGIGERETFGTGLTELWEDVLYSRGGYRLFRWILGIVLLVGTIWSAFLFKQMLDMMRPKETQIPPSRSVVAKESQRLGEEVEAFRRAVLAREGSNQLAVLASRIDRRPFAPGAYPAGAVEEGTAKTQEEDLPGQEKLFAAREEVLPPFMAVQAVMVMGSRRMAVMDIEGESPGMIVRSGSTFGDGKGKVLRVSPDLVVVSWADKRIEISVGM